MAETNWYIPTTDEIKASATRLGAWRPEVFDLWLIGVEQAAVNAEREAVEAVLAAHDAKVRTEVAQAVEEVLGRWCLGTPVEQMIVAEVRGAMFRADARTDRPNDNKTRWAKQLTPARPTV